MREVCAAAEDGLRARARAARARAREAKAQARRRDGGGAGDGEDDIGEADEGGEDGRDAVPSAEEEEEEASAAGEALLPLREMVSAHFLSRRGQTSAALEQFRRIDGLYPDNPYLLLRIATLQVSYNECGCACACACAYVCVSCAFPDPTKPHPSLLS